MSETLYDRCIRMGDRVLLSQWLDEKNAPLTPRDVAYGSKRKFWWRCAKGHEWRATVSSRTTPQACGCPVCAGRAKAVRVRRYEHIEREQKGEDLAETT